MLVSGVCCIDRTTRAISSKRRVTSHTGDPRFLNAKRVIEVPLPGVLVLASGVFSGHSHYSRVSSHNNILEYFSRRLSSELKPELLDLHFNVPFRSSQGIHENNK
jgi:hypothetical protein